MVAMGGFMAAAAHAIRMNNKPKRTVQREVVCSDDLFPEVSGKTHDDMVREGARMHDQCENGGDEVNERLYHDLELIAARQQERLEPSRVAAEAALGRPETLEEKISRECEVIGYSPASMTLNR